LDRVICRQPAKSEDVFIKAVVSFFYRVKIFLRKKSNLTEF
jgi:hypothetical protein